MTSMEYPFIISSVMPKDNFVSNAKARDYGIIMNIMLMLGIIDTYFQDMKSWQGSFVLILDCLKLLSI